MIQRPDVVWNDYETAADPQASETVREVLEYNLTDPQGWTLGEVAEDLQSRLGVSQDQALDIARNETSSVLNVTRAESLGEYAREVEDDPEEYEVDWVGPTDHRTTDICRETEQEIERRGGSVPVSELKGILMEKAQKYADRGGTPERVDEFHPHYNCRRTFVRRVQSL